MHYSSIATSSKKNGKIYKRIHEIKFFVVFLPRFSPPHTSICMSYLPSSANHPLSMENKPPAIAGDLEKKLICLPLKEIFRCKNLIT